LRRRRAGGDAQTVTADRSEEGEKEGDAAATDNDEKKAKAVAVAAPAGASLLAAASGAPAVNKHLVLGYLNLFSDGVHNFTDGMSLGSAFLHRVLLVATRACCS
ncbi:hypothetical protein CLOM_g11264, partial [Closterium sp. NIES-68]